MPCKKCENNKYRFGNGNCKYNTLAECEAAHQTYDIVELVIDETNEAIAIDAISLVTSPAIETPFVHFNDDKNKLTLAKIDEDKRMLVSPALIPYKQIYRYNADTDKHYYVYFTADTVRKAAEAFIKHHNTNNATIQHEYKVTGVSVIETWISEDSKKDKSNMYGYELPKGTWFVSMRIDNDEVWEQIKDGTLKGLSIEGYFVDKVQKMAKVGSMVADGMDLPLFDNEEEALAVAKEMGCEGVHEHTLDGNTVYMPCADHEIITALKQIFKKKKKKRKRYYDSYTNYPKGASNNAKRAIRENKKRNNKCATQTGKVRAQDLANRRPVSYDVVKRIYSYLSRAKTYDTGDYNDCGTISYNLWGGDVMLRWAERIVEAENKTN